MTAWIGAWRWLSPAWLVAALLVWLRIRLARRYGPESGRGHWTTFSVGIAALLIALVSPIAVLADGTLFSAHMAQHLLLLLIAPLFCTLGLPPAATERLFHGPRANRIGRVLAAPPLGWFLGIGMMWFWHAPATCDWSIESEWVAVAKYASLLVAGCAFWWPMFSPVSRYRAGPELAAIYLFTACLGCTLLGVFLTFADRIVCPAFADPVDPLHVLPGLEARGFTPDVDQRLGGLMMWVPTCTIYLSAIVAVMVRWYRVDKEPKHERSPQH
jgi:putative membrane protein